MSLTIDNPESLNRDKGFSVASIVTDMKDMLCYVHLSLTKIFERNIPLLPVQIGFKLAQPKSRPLKGSLLFKLGL
jgi:hypothetical protein